MLPPDQLKYPLINVNLHLPYMQYLLISQIDSVNRLGRLVYGNRAVFLVMTSSEGINNVSQPGCTIEKPSCWRGESPCTHKPSVNFWEEDEAHHASYHSYPWSSDIHCVGSPPTMLIMWLDPSLQEYLRNEPCGEPLHAPSSLLCFGWELVVTGKGVFWNSSQATSLQAFLWSRKPRANI